MGWNTISSQQEYTTEYTGNFVEHLMNYCATFSDAVLTFHASDMILHIHLNASFLNKPGTKSREGGFYFLSSDSKPPTDAPKMLHFIVFVKF